jgi:hypothetical protein
MAARRLLSIWMGQELARRPLDLRPKVKVLLMSGFERSGLRDTGWPVISKPLGITELMKEIEECTMTSPLPACPSQT